jgi:hypothetical protein
MKHVWTYNHREGGADVWRGNTASEAEREWVAHVPNGLVAQAMCDWLGVDVAGPLPLEMNPPRLYRRP